jgi:hypothetical protein
MSENQYTSALGMLTLLTQQAASWSLCQNATPLPKFAYLARPSFGNWLIWDCQVPLLQALPFVMSHSSPIM